MGKIIYRNKKLIKVIFIFVLLLCLLPVNADVEAVISESELFEEAYRHYLSYEPAKALELLDLFLREYPESSATDAILFWKAKSLLQLGKPAEARKIFSKLISDFPESYFKGLAEEEVTSIQEMDVDPTMRTEQPRKAPIVAGVKSDEDEKERIATLLNENENLQSEFAELRSKHEAAEKVLTEQKTASTEIKALKKQYEEAVSQIKSLETREAELSAVLEKVTEKETDWKKLDRSIKELQNEKQMLEQQVKERDQKLADYEKSVGELERQISEVKTERSRGTKDLSDRIAQLAQEKKELEEQIRQSSGSITGPMSDTTQKLRAELGELRKERNALEAVARNTDQKDKDIVRLEAELKQLEQSRQVLEQEVKARDQELIDYRKSIADLEEKITEVETDRDRRDRDMSAEIARLSEEKAQLEKRIKTRAGRVRVPKSEKDEKNRLEAELKQLEQSRKEAEQQADRDIRRLEAELGELRKERASLELVARDTEQKDRDIVRLEAELGELEKEKTALETRVRDAEQKDAEIQRLEANLKDLESRIAASDQSSRDAEARIVKLTEEKGQLEQQLKEEQTRAAQLKQKINEKERMAKQIELGANMDIVRLQADLEKKEREYEENRVLAIKLQKEKKDLEAWLQERESSITVVPDNTAEKKVLETELKQLKQSMKELQAQTDKDVKQLRNDLRKQTELAEEYARSIEQLKSQEKQMKESYNDLTRLHDGRKKELNTLRETIKQYEAPVVVIDKSRYSILDILNDHTLSSAVLSKIGDPFVLWRSDNLYEDFITERILLRKAQEEGIREDRSTVKSMSSDYGLNKDEKEYLTKYLNINKFISRHMSGDVVDDRAVRNFYEAHRADYVRTPGVQTFSVLRLRYSEQDEINKALLATSLRERMNAGESSKEIYESMPDLLAFETVTNTILPEWVNNKIGSLKKGKVSDIIILDDAFHIFRLVSEEAPIYKNYETVKDEIKKDLLLQKKIDSLPITEWLREIRSEAVQIR